MILEINNLQHSYDGTTQSIKDVNFKVRSGEFISILGHSGCGKSTLLRLIAGLEEQTKGTIKINGEIISDDKFQTPTEKRGLGLVVQEKALFPHLSVLKNTSFGIKNNEAGRSKAMNLLELFEVSHLASKYPNEISGGEQQRVALARALAPEPIILLLDEPFNALDEELKNNLHNETKKIIEEKNLTVLMVSHDKNEATFFSDRQIIMENGRIIEEID
ncbi:ABC transporter ATP-binding protein [Gammaproteobacteria bacterium]|nr:ABC transporter ATP-binding protein [Gammaproteobacteria bacterium]